MSKISLAEILVEEFMIPLSMGSADVAEKTGIDESTIVQILCHGKQIDQNIADKLAAGFDTTPEFWLNIQANYTKE